MRAWLWFKETMKPLRSLQCVQHLTAEGGTGEAQRRHTKLRPPERFQESRRKRGKDRESRSVGGRDRGREEEEEEERKMVMVMGM